MNFRILLSLVLIFSLSLQTKAASKLSDLKTGDWFTLEYIRYLTPDENKQSLRNAEIIEFKVTVLANSGRDVQFAIRPFRLRFNQITPLKTDSRIDHDRYDCNHFDSFALDEASNEMHRL